MPGFEQTEADAQDGHALVADRDAVPRPTCASGKDRLLGETEDIPYREGAKQAFSIERTGVAAMCSGSSSAASSSASTTPRTCVRFGKPIGEHQLIQEKLARMEMHRLNIENLVFRTIEKGVGRAPRWTSPRRR